MHGLQSNLKQPSCKKVCCPEEGHSEGKKRCEIQDGGQEMAVLVGVTKTQVNLCCLLHVSLVFGTKDCHILNFLPTITAISWPPPWISQNDLLQLD